MARNSEDEEAACKGSTSEKVEDDDETLSLSDLPLNLVIEDKILQSSKEATPVKENQEEFNFDSWGGSLSTESEMCAADEVFFKGQILPLRLSVSSDSGLTRFQQHDSRNTSRCISRSESMGHGSSSNMGGLTSINSSRSSSTRSHHSSNGNSSSSSSCSITTVTRKSKPRIRNQFHTFPSPKPQIRVSNTRLLGKSSSSRNQKSSTVWDFFRLGLVRAPEIEFQDLKVRNNINNNANCRNSVSRNSSSGSSSTNSSSGIKNYSSCKMMNSSSNVVAKNQQDSSSDQKQQKRQSFLDKRRRLFNGCKCSINAVETVPLNNIVIFKSRNSDGSNSNNNSKKNCNNESSAVDDMEKKLQELKIKQKMKEKQQGKQAMSRHRTFEWLKELSHATSYIDRLETQ